MVNAIGFFEFLLLFTVQTGEDRVDEAGQPRSGRDGLLHFLQTGVESQRPRFRLDHRIVGSGGGAVSLVLLVFVEEVAVTLAGSDRSGPVREEVRVGCCGARGGGGVGGSGGGGVVGEDAFGAAAEYRFLVFHPFLDQTGP